MWGQLANAILGSWMMAAPSLLNYAGAARANDLILGPISASLAIIAIWDVCPSLGKANLLVGLWLVLAPWLLAYGGWPSTINSALAGTLMCLFAFAAGAPRGGYGGGWSSLRES
jgi:hypothetical protein